MADILPFVEKVAGARLKKLPELKLVDWREVGRVLARDLLLPHAGGEGRSKRAPLADQFMELTAMQTTLPLAPFVIGKYAVSSSTLYLLPRNMSATMELVGLDHSAAEPVAKLTPWPTNLFMPCRTNAWTCRRT